MTKYSLDPVAKEKLDEKWSYSVEKRKKVHKKLEEYPPSTQKQWVANPMMQFIIQGYLNNMHANFVKNTSAPVAKKDEKKVSTPVAEPDEPDSDGDEMMNLFD